MDDRTPETENAGESRARDPAPRASSGDGSAVRRRLRFIQAKNEHRRRVEINIPVHPVLAAAIDGLGERPAFLLTDYGKPFSAAGFGNWFREKARDAGLPDECRAHGLRKATAALLAEAGATPHEIMAVTGHQTLEEVERYTRAARQSLLADSAFRRLGVM